MRRFAQVGRSEPCLRSLEFSQVGERGVPWSRVGCCRFHRETYPDVHFKGMRRASECAAS